MMTVSGGTSRSSQLADWERRRRRTKQSTHAQRRRRLIKTKIAIARARM